MRSSSHIAAKWAPTDSSLYLLFFPLCMRLTVSLPAVSPDREGGDSISGNPGGGGCDLHLDTSCTFLVVALQRCAMQWRLDGVTHLMARKSTVNKALLITVTTQEFWLTRDQGRIAQRLSTNEEVNWPTQSLATSSTCFILCCLQTQIQCTCFESFVTGTDVYRRVSTVWIHLNPVTLTLEITMHLH